MSVPKKASLTKNDVHNHYAIALERFIQSNVKSSYMDFRILIQTIHPNDYAYMLLADKMADLGFFNLSELAVSKIYDEDISFVIIDDIKRFYYPAVKLNAKDEIYLGEMFSNIIYNAQSKEAVTELLKNEQLVKDSDYANYIIALGFLKSGDAENASNYIDFAISKNPSNINYKKLKAEIAVQNNENAVALKTIAEIKKAPFVTAEYRNKVDSLEHYILYKTEKDDYLKKYHLAYYYYDEGELTKAVRTLQNTISSKKKYNKLIYSLLSKVYLDTKEYEKAESFAQKTLNIDSGNALALTVLGDISAMHAQYTEAEKFYSKAAANEKNNPNAAVKAAHMFQLMNNSKQADEIYSKILKEYSDCPMAYYNVALKDLSRRNEYLKKALALNISLTDAWLELAKSALDSKLYDTAKRYLAIAKYIDENNFKYYYYQGLLCKGQGLKQDAIFNFRKCLALNPNFEPAKKELSI